MRTDKKFLYLLIQPRSDREGSWIRDSVQHKVAGYRHKTGNIKNEIKMRECWLGLMQNKIDSK